MILLGRQTYTGPATMYFLSIVCRLLDKNVEVDVKESLLWEYFSEHIP